MSAIIKTENTFLEKKYHTGKANQNTHF